jgi:hypothetical protein
VNPKKIVIKKQSNLLMMSPDSAAEQRNNLQLPKSIIKLRTTKLHANPKPVRLQRPSTPEQNKDQCFECDPMRDHI